MKQSKLQISYAKFTKWILETNINKKEILTMEFKIIEKELLPIYENEKKEKLVNARELHEKLGNKRKFADWIKQRISV